MAANCFGVAIGITAGTIPGKGLRSSWGIPGHRGARFRPLRDRGLERIPRMAKRIAFLTAGGIAPCLSSSIGALVERYNELAPDAELIGYLNGYRGLLLGRSVTFSGSLRKNYAALYQAGGSIIGNSRVKLTNVKDCIARGLVQPGQTPLQVAADQLRADRIDILHTIGGDDTNTTAADLAGYLESNGYDLTVVGLPKTVDNDVHPIRQTLGAWTAAEQGHSFRNIANENTTSSRQLIIHEVMGRHCGWLAAATAHDYHHSLDVFPWFPELLLERARWDIDAVFLSGNGHGFRCRMRTPSRTDGSNGQGPRLPERRRRHRDHRPRV